MLPTIKRQSIKTLPRHLMICLKRFDFDYEVMQQVKINERLEFPHEVTHAPSPEPSSLHTCINLPPVFNRHACFSPDQFMRPIVTLPVACCSWTCSVTRWRAARTPLRPPATPPPTACHHHRYTHMTHTFFVPSWTDSYSPLTMIYTSPLSPFATVGGGRRQRVRVRQWRLAFS